MKTPQPNILKDAYIIKLYDNKNSLLTNSEMLYEPFVRKGCIVKLQLFNASYMFDEYCYKHYKPSQLLDKYLIKHVIVCYSEITVE